MLYDYSMMQKRALLYKVAMQKRALLYKAAKTILLIKLAAYFDDILASFNNASASEEGLQKLWNTYNAANSANPASTFNYLTNLKKDILAGNILKNESVIDSIYGPGTSEKLYALHYHSTSNPTYRKQWNSLVDSLHGNIVNSFDKNIGSNLQGVADRMANAPLSRSPSIDLGITEKPPITARQNSTRKGFWTRLRERLASRRKAKQLSQPAATQPVQQPIVQQPIVQAPSQSIQPVQNTAVQNAQAAANRAVQETTSSVPTTMGNKTVSNRMNKAVGQAAKANKWLAASVALGMPLTAAGGYYLYNKYYGSPSGSTTPTV